MGLNPRPLSEDRVDSFTHFWSVAFFLSLAFFLLVIPGSPSKNITQQEHQQTIPQYQASCWCPAQFTASHVDYTNNVCSRAFNSLLRGDKEHSYASLDNVLFAESVEPTKQTDGMDLLKNIIANLRKGEGLASNEKEASHKMGSVWENGPVIMIALALGLRVPQLLTSIASMCCCGANLGQTLESARQGEVLTSEERRQLYAGFVTGFKGKKTSTYLYMMMKLLMIFIVIAEFIVVQNHILPNIEEEEGNENMKSSTTPALDGAIADQQLDGMVHHCFFDIRQMTNVHDYAVQCIFNKQSIQQQLSMPESKILSTNVFLMVMVTLVLLVFVNVLNTLVWLITLARDSTRTRLGLDKTAPLDLVLFYLMARTHLSMSVVARPAECNSVDADYSGEDGGHIPQKM